MRSVFIPQIRTGAIFGLLFSAGFAAIIAQPSVLDAQDVADKSRQSTDRDDRDIVVYAGGAIRLRPPIGWHVVEVPVGRELRLFVTPIRLDATRRTLDDGVWLTPHILPPEETTNDEALFDLLRTRLRLARPTAVAIGEVQSKKIGRWPAFFQRFATRTIEGDDPRTEELAGFHLLARTSWGLVELHAVAPLADAVSRRPQFERLVADLQLREPFKAAVELAASVRDAKSIVGTWKSFGGRMRLLADGRIVVEADRENAIRTDGAAGENQGGASTPVAGQFQAHGDLLMVRWADGSRLNYRWRLRGADLLLTDNEGQISHLRRVLQ